MRHLGTKTIETEGFILRKFELADAEDMYKNWANDDDVTKYITWPTHMNIETTRNVVSQYVKESALESYYHWCIESKKTKEAIGSIGVFHMSENTNTFEVGYCIGKSYWNQGVTTEALSAVINFLFSEVDVNRIEARHDTNNPASGKVMSKCGLKLEGIMRQAGKNNTGICDSAVYAILKEDWNKRKSSIVC